MENDEESLHYDLPGLIQLADSSRRPNVGGKLLMNYVAD